MIKFTLVRKISGKKIKKDLRNKELHPTTEFTVTDTEGNVIKHTSKVYVRYENKGLYDENRPKKRHVENPTVYKSEDYLFCNPRNIRVPSKKRKTAMKRFKRAFPYMKVNSKNEAIFVAKKMLSDYPLKPMPKKILN